MFFSRFVLPVIALISALCVLAACGGGTAGTFDSALDTPDNSFVGITDGEFKAVRFNEAGIRDAALNSTIGFSTNRTGGFTEVTIAVNDTGNMLGVTMELDYDSNRFHPVGAEFHGLIDSPIEAYIPNRVGTVSLGQVAFEEAARSGDFATVRFADGPGSAIRGASVIHGGMLDEQYDAPALDAGNYAEGFAVAANGADWDITINSVFAQGDGDDNGETNVADLSALVIQGNFTVSVSDTNFGPAATDYDRNGEVNLADIAIIAINNQANVDHIDVLVSDSADMTDATVYLTFTFGDGAPAARSGLPFTAATWDPVWRTWTGMITAADITAADTNADGEVFLSGVTSDGATNGTPSDAGISVTVIADPDITVTGIDVEMDGTPVGAFVDLIANNAYAFDVVGISGNYDDGSGIVPFVAADAGTIVPQGEYDAALLATQTAATWAVTWEATPGYKLTSDCLVLDTAAGGSVVGTAFPDWDPESVNPVFEGNLTVTSDTNEVSIDLDISMDPVAPELDPLLASDHGQDVDSNWILNTVGESFISGVIVWGSALPAADSDVMVQLFDFTNGSHRDFTHTVNNPPASGEFTIDGGTLLSLTVAPADLGSLYGLRVSNGDTTAAGVWSSVNLPGFWFSTGDVSPTVDFETIPSEDAIGPGDGFLQLVYPDPQIRRDPTVTWDDINQTFEGTNPVAYNDILKVQGENGEFPLGIDGFDHYPRLALIEGLVDDIGPGTTETLGTLITVRNPNKVVIDIALLTLGGGIGDPPKNYAYKLYGKFDNEVGAGTFSVAQMPLLGAVPMGVNWGINAFDGAGRGDLTYATADWTGHLLHADTAGTAVPDVLFVEFNGGTLGNYPATVGNGNVEIVLSDGVSPFNIAVDVRTAGMDALGLNFIAVYEFMAEDYFDPINNPNGLQVGAFPYEVQLDDAAFPGSPDWASADLMTIIN